MDYRVISRHVRKSSVQVLKKKIMSYFRFPPFPLTRNVFHSDVQTFEKHIFSTSVTRKAAEFLHPYLPCGLHTWVVSFFPSQIKIVAPGVVCDSEVRRAWVLFENFVF